MQENFKEVVEWEVCQDGEDHYKLEHGHQEEKEHGNLLKERNHHTFQADK